MSYLVANLPPVECYVRKEYLYDLERGYGDLHRVCGSVLNQFAPEHFILNLC